MNISYTPEKIDEFVTQAQKDVQTAEGLFRVFYTTLKSTNIKDVIENTESFQEYANKINIAAKSIEKKMSKYFDIVDLYEFGNMPDNVKTLDDLCNKLDNLYTDISNLGDAANNILDAGKELGGQFFTK